MSTKIKKKQSEKEKQIKELIVPGRFFEQSYWSLQNKKIGFKIGPNWLTRSKTFFELSFILFVLNMLQKIITLVIPNADSKNHEIDTSLQQLKNVQHEFLVITNVITNTFFVFATIFLLVAIICLIISLSFNSNNEYKKFKIWYLAKTNMSLEIMKKEQKIVDNYHILKSKTRIGENSSLELSQIMFDEWNLDKRYGPVEELNQDNKGKLIKVSDDLNKFFRFTNDDMQIFKLDHNNTSTSLIKLFNDILDENNITDRYSYFLNLQKFLLKNKFIERITYLERNRVYITNSEFEIMNTELKDDIINGIDDFINKNNIRNINKTRNNQKFYYQNYKDLVE